MGAGYVGEKLLRHLQAQKHQLSITTTRKERVGPLSCYGQSVLLPREDKAFKELLDSCDGIIILVAPKNLQSYEEVYLQTAKKIFFALKNRKKPFYLLYTSSTSVCEGQKNEWVTEDMELYPKSESAKILLEAEYYYLSCNASACILRLGGIYGPKRELLDRVKRFSGKTMPSTGEEPTNHIHLEDIIAAVLFCLNHSLKGIYHLVNDDHTSRKKLYSHLCQLAGIPCPIWGKDLPKSSYKVCNQKIKSMGFTFKHPKIQRT
ncbi:Protein YeeZ [Candidatus Rhabdochlamydia porcellionis]|uniref:Protein YeeZ n=2 Tax=Candidatus Rhabdochlamydia porcellionis TaxID=225148 RepID=A0ABX8YZQ5_9BACT|nr:Protein YeeZ [Candidatus Rhabdochlamydia porcellionis]